MQSIHDEQNDPVISDAEASGAVSDEAAADASESKPRLSISKTVALVCAAIVLVALGAGIMARYISDRPEEVRIFEAETSGTGISSVISSTVKEKVTTASERAVPAAVTTVPVTSADVPETAETVSYSFPADLNTASAEMLSSVNGINRSVAESIVSYRIKAGIIHSYEELLDIYGIGERTLNVIREYFYISAEDLIPVTSSVTEKVTAAKTEKTSKQTTAKETKTSRQTSPASETVTEPPREPRKINLNTATAEELADALLIDLELAEKVITHRDLIGGFADPREVMNVPEFSRELFTRLFDYMTLGEETEQTE